MYSVILLELKSLPFNSCCAPNAWPFCACVPTADSLASPNTLQMSDVEAGGATVFPQINVALWPKKGAAAFWYNLHPSGEGDELTRHAACPVLVGTKWGKKYNHVQHCTW